MLTHKTKDLTDKRFGRLLAVQVEGKNKAFQLIWLCKCDCGNFAAVLSSNLIRGVTKSCGCLNRQVITKHGLRRSPSYQSWRAMKERCLNPNNKAYEHYGQRGIIITPKWIESFQAFIDDIGERPSSEHSLERKNVNLGYNKDNCIWILKKDQSKNTRRSLKNR